MTSKNAVRFFSSDFRGGFLVEILVGLSATSASHQSAAFAVLQGLDAQTPAAGFLEAGICPSLTYDIRETSQG